MVHMHHSQPLKMKFGTNHFLGSETLMPLQYREGVNMSLNTRIFINPLSIFIIRTFFLYLVIPIIKDLLFIHVNCKKAMEHIIIVVLQAASKAKILSRILLSLEEKQMFEQNISVEFKEKLPILILHCLVI